MESEQLPRTVIQAVDSSFGERRLAMLVLLAKLVRTSGRMKEAICTDESALALWGILSGVASKISELKEAAATPSEEQGEPSATAGTSHDLPCLLSLTAKSPAIVRAEPLPEDMDPKQAKEKEKEREEAARAREERFKEGMAQLGPEGTPQGLAVMMQGVRSVLEGRTRTSSAVADRGDVSHLSCLLSHADPAVAVEACRLLRALGRTAVGARECLKADLGAPALEIAGSAEAPPGLRCAALELLCQLCASSGGQVVELVDAGAVPTLLAIAAGETAPESLRASAVQLLAALMARSVTAIDQLWKAGGFACLRALLPRVPGIEFHEAPPVEEPEAAPEPEPPATGKGKGAAKGKAAAGKQAPGGDGGKESDRQSVAASPVGGQRTPRVGPGQVAPPESPSRSSVVHQHVALTMSSVLRLPTLRQRVLREDQEAAEDGKRGGEGEGGPEGSGGEGTADDGIRRATVAETMFFLLSKGQSRSASPEPEETPPEAAPGSKVRASPPRRCASLVLARGPLSGRGI